MNDFHSSKETDDEDDEPAHEPVFFASWKERRPPRAQLTRVKERRTEVSDVLPFLPLRGVVVYQIRPYL